MHVAFGRRYGVVGRNGVGKSTLLRALLRRDLPVPETLQIEYVEQHVGDVSGEETQPIRDTCQRVCVRARVRAGTPLGAP